MVSVDVWMCVVCACVVWGITFRSQIACIHMFITSRPHTAALTNHEVRPLFRAGAVPPIGQQVGGGAGGCGSESGSGKGQQRSLI